jgi:hypothetical protein
VGGACGYEPFGEDQPGQSSRSFPRAPRRRRSHRVATTGEQHGGQSACVLPPCGPFGFPDHEPTMNQTTDSSWLPPLTLDCHLTCKSRTGWQGASPRRRGQPAPTRRGRRYSTAKPAAQANLRRRGRRRYRCHAERRPYKCSPKGERHLVTRGVGWPTSQSLGASCGHPERARPAPATNDRRLGCGSGRRNRARKLRLTRGPAPQRIPLYRKSFCGLLQKGSATHG